LGNKLNSFGHFIIFSTFFACCRFAILV